MKFASYLFCISALVSPLTTYNVQAESFLAQQTSGNPYPQEFVIAYLQNCTQEATSQGLPKEAANTMCKCTIGKFQSQYNLEQMKKLIADSQNNPQVKRTLTQVGYSCLDEILYEP